MCEIITGKELIKAGYRGFSVEENGLYKYFSTEVTLSLIKRLYLKTITVCWKRHNGKVKDETICLLDIDGIKGDSDGLQHRGRF